MGTNCWVGYKLLGSNCWVQIGGYKLVLQIAQIGYKQIDGYRLLGTNWLVQNGGYKLMEQIDGLQCFELNRAFKP